MSILRLFSLLLVLLSAPAWAQTGAPSDPPGGASDSGGPGGGCPAGSECRCSSQPERLAACLQLYLTPCRAEGGALRVRLGDGAAPTWVRCVPGQGAGRPRGPADLAAAPGTDRMCVQGGWCACEGSMSSGPGSVYVCSIELVAQCHGSGGSATLHIFPDIADPGSGMGVVMCMPPM